MKDKKQNEELISKSFFHEEINPMKKDISELKTDVKALKVDFFDLKAEMRDFKESLILAMCEQTQKIIDHFDGLFAENKKEHFEMRRDIKACKNELGL